MTDDPLIKVDETEKNATSGKVKQGELYMSCRKKTLPVDSVIKYKKTYEEQNLLEILRGELVMKSTICGSTAFICLTQSFWSVNSGLHQCN